jgi:hypothetical protein
MQELKQLIEHKPAMIWGDVRSIADEVRAIGLQTG